MFELTMKFANEEALQAWLTNRKESETPVETETAEAAAEPTVVTTDGSEEDTPSRDEVDADGMPYNDEYHSDPPAVTAKGLWRSRRGKTDEANAARAAFKAAGATEEPPADVETRAAPAMPASAAMPGAAPVSREPVTLDDLFAKISEMLEAGALPQPTLFGMYRTATGLADDDTLIAQSAGPVFAVNETARATMMGLLEAV